MRREADLYGPVKAFLEAQGYEVKAEIGACDLMACRDGDPPLVVEMKTGFSLTLVLQGVARLALFDTVYLAAGLGPKGWGPRYREVTALCRRLGLGLLAVRPDGTVEAHLDPGPYEPRRNAVRAGRLLREFQRRVGDPNTGGTTGVKRMTAYRQDALRCLDALAAGPRRAADVARDAGVARATALMRADHYGWFDHPGRGLYALSPRGISALAEHAEELARLKAPKAE
ncbi:DUF2161 family putative PD-(D/E)XK-type phosphodiesterase [Neotabrizicola sp. VNH66]|uniref:DUF2161 family putative PD-(D/E)XK-type phosphodiesterase n=1 Tax=Neotabrizicola sp. VNH66 TaxID=3400918 RepID=UPI003C06965B